MTVQAIKEMIRSKSRLSGVFNLFRKWKDRYMNRFEIIVIVALVGYILGLTIFLVILW